MVATATQDNDTRLVWQSENASGGRVCGRHGFESHCRGEDLHNRSRWRRFISTDVGIDLSRSRIHHVAVEVREITAGSSSLDAAGARLIGNRSRRGLWSRSCRRHRGCRRGWCGCWRRRRCGGWSYRCRWLKSCEAKSCQCDNCRKLFCCASHLVKVSCRPIDFVAGQTALSANLKESWPKPKPGPTL